MDMFVSKAMHINLHNLYKNFELWYIIWRSKLNLKHPEEISGEMMNMMKQNKLRIAEAIEKRTLESETDL